LLPNRFRAPVYYVFESAVNARGSVFLHSRHDVTIEIECDPDLAMAQAFTRNLRMDAAGKHVCRVSVPQIVEAKPRQRLVVREQLMPLVRDGSRLQGTAICLRNDKSVVR
jgi:hypothetical protein